ncbi:MAG: amphi-Trp domain-containing protein [Candidatus Coatesbacteria bacterium]|nr:amphi-Trp domain-containing protein [Candidatus Coatesbacteria bacterium]
MAKKKKEKEDNVEKAEEFDEEVVEKTASKEKEPREISLIIFERKEKKMGKKEVELEGKVDLKQAISFMEGLLTGLKEGTICLEKGDNTIVLKPINEVFIEIKAIQKKDKEKLSFELCWVKEIEEPLEEAVELKIFSAEP